MQYIRMATSSQNLTEIPVFVDGVEKWVTGISPKTTCDDVVHSLLINIDCPVPHEAVREYTIYETYRGVEKPLKGRSKLLKLWKERQNDNVTLILRKVDSAVKSNVYGSVTKVKSKAKSWFRIKDRRNKPKQLFNVTHEDTACMLEDSSMMHNKDTLFCAIKCCSAKRPVASNAPFERPQMIHSKSRRNPAFVDEPQYSSERVIAKESMNQYASVSNMKTAAKSCSVSSIPRNPSQEHLYSVVREPIYGKHKASDYGYAKRIQQTQDIYGNGMKTMVSMILNQQKHIQEQFERIQEADDRISNYEIKMHKLRSESHGNNYLQETYLNEALLEVDGLESCEHLYEDIVKIDAELVEQYAKVETLTGLLYSETQRMNESCGPLESTRIIDPVIQKQIDELKTQLKESAKVSQQREKEIEELDNCFVKLNQQLKEKEDILNRLSCELEKNTGTPMKPKAEQVVADESSLCNMTDDVKQQSINQQHCVLPPMGVETIAKMFSSRLMPDLTPSEPTRNITIDLNNTDVNQTSIWDTEDDGIDVTFVAQPVGQQDVCLTMLDGTVVTNNTVDSTVNDLSNVSIKLCKIKKRLFQNYNTVDKLILNTIAGDMSASRLSDSTESGVGSLNSDDSAGEMTGWGRMETTL